MTTTKQIALCDNLNMNFDEATELFSPESLNNMQIAQVNGGIAWWLVAKAVIEAIGLVASVIAIYDYCQSTDGPTEASGSRIKYTEGGVTVEVDFVLYGDSLKIGTIGEEKYVTISRATPAK